ncbi:MAG TPA: 23S rRNA (pseudouridine(1915)-N(3))-methyltransferase RlmH [Thermoanaerobaculia bacterium]|nr:23S rRNA (pseudouridine(1915)-N(3))-methyltransferase RlmH [Thermoanaerobaculia bacterium]
MKFTFVFAGSHSDEAMSEAAERYLNRIKHFYPTNVIEVKPERGRQSASDEAIIRRQSARLAAAIPQRGYTVVLDERGQALDSLKFAKWLERLTIDSPDGVNFVVGGDVGYDETVKGRADKLLSLSAMTFPHQFARVVLLEQIYRACTLMRNIPYHK